MAKKTKKLKADESHLRIRMPGPLLARLQKAAEIEGVTVTSEVVRRLDWSFRLDEVITRKLDELNTSFMERRMKRWLAPIWDELQARRAGKSEEEIAEVVRQAEARSRSDKPEDK